MKEAGNSIDTLRLPHAHVHLFTQQEANAKLQHLKIFMLNPIERRSPIVFFTFDAPIAPKIHMADDDESSDGCVDDEPLGTGGTGEYVTELGSFDVLLGRGTGPSMHEGNVHFRLAVEDLKPSYVSTNSRKRKKELVRKAVHTIQAKNGRFLTKLTKGEMKALGLKGKAAYEVVRDIVAMEKTKQAIRYVHYKKKEPAMVRRPAEAEEAASDITSRRIRYVLVEHMCGVLQNLNQNSSLFLRFPFLLPLTH